MKVSSVPATFQNPDIGLDPERRGRNVCDVPAYSGGNRWMGVVGLHDPPPAPSLKKLSERERFEAPSDAYASLAHRASTVRPDVNELSEHAKRSRPTYDLGEGIRVTIDDLRNALRAIGRVYHFDGREEKALVCKMLVKQLVKDSQAPTELVLPDWLTVVLLTGFSAKHD